MNRCRSCGAEVLWLKNRRTGKRAPIDRDPSAGGNVIAYLLDQTYRVLSADECEIAKADGMDLHTNHFVTCPQAGQWHKAKQKAGAP